MMEPTGSSVQGDIVDSIRPCEIRSHGSVTETQDLPRNFRGNDGRGTSEGGQEDVTCRPREGSHPVWQGQDGPAIQGGIRRWSLDGLVCDIVREQHQGRVDGEIEN